MKKYKAQVIYNVDIVLPDDSELNKEEWIKIVACNAAYHGRTEHATLVNKEITVKAMEE